MCAALRCAMFGKKVLLLEKHYVVGGLNSFYARGGRKFDVGLHALTNFPSPFSGKSSPLLKLCRQLRIPFDSLLLHEQSHSRITFGDSNLCFNNNFEFFLSEIEKVFPKEKDRFQDLLKKMESFPAYSVRAEEISGRKILEEQINDPLLREMLLCPTCYYGSARQNDIDFPTFVMLFDAIFKQGLARPEKGIRAILDPLVKKLKEHGVERKMNAPVFRMKANNGRIIEIELESGNCFTADQFISTCGGVETENLLGLPEHLKETEQGKFTIIESMSVFKGHPKEFGWEETVIFFNRSNHFHFNEPQDLIDLDTGVICLPENYGHLNESKNNESKLRITHPANFDLWNQLSESEYQKNKKICESQILENGLNFLKNGSSLNNEFETKTVMKDTFTPKTIKRFTGHEKGTLYGSPTKKRDGATRFENLFLAGTDQGYIGIVGAMLGGIAVANNQILRRN